MRGNWPANRRQECPDSKRGCYSRRGDIGPIIDDSKTPAVPRDLKICPGKKLYIRKLELLEKVVIPRLPVTESPIWIARTVTWSRALPLPIIVESLSEDEIWRDVEKMLLDFAEDFKQGNNIRK